MAGAVHIVYGVTRNLARAAYMHLQKHAAQNLECTCSYPLWSFVLGWSAAARSIRYVAGPPAHRPHVPRGTAMSRARTSFGVHSSPTAVIGLVVDLRARARQWPPLDRDNGERVVVQLLTQLRTERGLGLLLVSHDMPLVTAHTEATLLVQDGRLAADSHRD